MFTIFDGLFLEAFDVYRLSDHSIDDLFNNQLLVNSWFGLVVLDSGGTHK